MAEVRWTPQAVEDLESIADFIARDSGHYARLFVIDAIAITKRLEMYPMSGRVVPEIDDSALREIVSGNYRMVYRIKDETVEILTVYHAARLLDPDRFK